MTLSAERRAQIEEAIKYASGTQRVHREWRKQYIHDVTELLTALDEQHRTTIHAEVAANQIWQAYDDLQQVQSPPFQRRTREQIVGLVPDAAREGE